MRLTAQEIEARIPATGLYGTDPEEIVARYYGDRPASICRGFPPPEELEKEDPTYQKIHHGGGFGGLLSGRGSGRGVSGMASVPIVSLSDFQEAEDIYDVTDFWKRFYAGDFAVWFPSLNDAMTILVHLGVDGFRPYNHHGGGLSIYLYKYRLGGSLRDGLGWADKLGYFDANANCYPGLSCEVVVPDHHLWLSWMNEESKPGELYEKAFLNILAKPVV